jgi:uncharacterized membrane protein
MDHYTGLFVMTEELYTLVLAMVPIGELRLSIPVALTIYNLDVATAYVLSVVGNIIPVAVLLLLFTPVSKWLAQRSRLFNTALLWLSMHVHARYKSQVDRYGRLALILFVAIPLPFTGAWTGALAAVFFGVPFRKALLSLVTGVLIAGVVVTVLTLLGVNIADTLGLAAFSWFIAALVLVAVVYYIVVFRRRNTQ